MQSCAPAASLCPPRCPFRPAQHNVLLQVGKGVLQQVGNVVADILRVVGVIPQWPRHLPAFHNVKQVRQNDALQVDAWRKGRWKSKKAQCENMGRRSERETHRRQGPLSQGRRTCKMRAVRHDRQNLLHNLQVKVDIKVLRHLRDALHAVENLLHDAQGCSGRGQGARMSNNGIETASCLPPWGRPLSDNKKKEKTQGATKGARGAPPQQGGRCTRPTYKCQRRFAWGA